MTEGAGRPEHTVPAPQRPVSMRERRLQERVTSLTRSLDEHHQELDEVAAAVRSATSDLDRAKRSAAWRLAHRVGTLAAAATIGRSRLGVDELDAAAGVLKSLERGLMVKPKAGPRGERSSSRRHVTVVSWDMSHNGMIRAHYIADLLRRRYDVQHIGPCFPHFGTEIWEPVRSSGMPMRTFPGTGLPELVRDTERFLHGLRTDVVYVCKARFPSLLIGMLLKHVSGVPVILDVDEVELGFVGAGEGISLEELQARREESDYRLAYGKLWTQASHELVSEADAVVVASEVLQPLFGGTVVRHVRDELTFDPARFDRDAVRAEFGYGPADRVVMFAGTANRHKGVLEIARALEEIGDPAFKLCIVGSLGDPTMRTELARLAASRIQLIDFQPVGQIPRLTAMGDLMCLAQNPQSQIARYQTPAKLTEGLAMGVPVLAHESPPLERFVRDDLINAIGSRPLSERISELLSEPEALRDRAGRGREFFLEHMSYAAGEEKLDQIIGDLQGKASEVGSGWSRAYELAREVPSEVDSRPLAHRRAAVAPGARWDIVLFWRLSYSDVYGRRPDLLIKYLAQSDRTRKLVLFDRPTDWSWLESRRRAARSGVNHFDLIARRGRRLAWRAEHRGKLTKHMFIAQPAKDPTAWQRALLPTADEYLGYVQDALQRDGMGRSSPLMFFVWPPMEHFAQLHEAIAPDLTVSDVIDDERAWVPPGSAAHERLTRNHQAILAASDLVITHNQPLADRLRMFGVEAKLVSNATELFPDAPKARPRELRGLEGPLIGYTGTLSWRFDIELVDRLARARRDCQIVIIGSAHGSEEILVLSRHPNVHFLGVKTYPDVVRYIRCFDVGIIPHLNDTMSRSMNPLKAYLYASCGVPAVSTEVANLVRLDGAIRVTSTHEAFIAAVSEVIEQRRRGKLSLDPRSLLRGQTWADRVQELEQLIDDVLEDRAAAVRISA